MKSDLIDLAVDVLHTTDRAVLVRDHDTGKEIWVPLCHCELRPSDEGDGHNGHMLTLPEWFAIEKELL